MVARVGIDAATRPGVFDPVLADVGRGLISVKDSFLGVIKDLDKLKNDPVCLSKMIKLTGFIASSVAMATGGGGSVSGLARAADLFDHKNNMIDLGYTLDALPFFMMGKFKTAPLPITFSKMAELVAVVGTWALFLNTLGLVTLPFIPFIAAATSAAVVVVFAFGVGTALKKYNSAKNELLVATTVEERNIAEAKKLQATLDIARAVSEIALHTLCVYGNLFTVARQMATIFNASKIVAGTAAAAFKISSFVFQLRREEYGLISAQEKAENRPDDEPSRVLKPFEWAEMSFTDDDGLHRVTKLVQSGFRIGDLLSISFQNNFAEVESELSDAITVTDGLQFISRIREWFVPVGEREDGTKIYECQRDNWSDPKKVSRAFLGIGHIGKFIKVLDTAKLTSVGAKLGNATGKLKVFTLIVDGAIVVSAAADLVNLGIDRNKLDQKKNEIKNDLKSTRDDLQRMGQDLDGDAATHRANLEVKERNLLKDLDLARWKDAKNIWGIASQISKLVVIPLTWIAAAYLGAPLLVMTASIVLVGLVTNVALYGKYLIEKEIKTRQLRGQFYHEPEVAAAA